MRFWEENGKLVKGLGVAFLALIAMKYTVVSWQTTAKEGDTARYEELKLTLKNQRKGVYDVDDAITALRRESSGLDAEVKGLMKRVEIPFHPWVKIPPAYAGEPGAYFVLKHAEQRDELYIACQVGSRGRAVELSDPTLGFASILGKPLNNKQAQENLNRLSIVVRLVKLLAQAGVVEIVKISPGEPVKTGPAEHAAMMREYPVNIQVRTRIDPLMKFLHSVRRPGEFFLVVRGLDVRGSDPYGRKNRPAGIDENELMVSITAAGMRFFTEEEREAAPKPKGKRPRKGAPRKWKKALGA